MCVTSLALFGGYAFKTEEFSPAPSGQAGQLDWAFFVGIAGAVVALIAAVLFYRDGCRLAKIYDSYQATVTVSWTAPYGPQGCNTPCIICWFRRYINCLFALVNFFPYIYFFEKPVPFPWDRRSWKATKPGIRLVSLFCVLVYFVTDARLLLLCQI